MYSSKFILFLSITLIILIVLTEHPIEGMDSETKRELRLKVIEMFKHAYNSYMNNAFPADELMPLSCKGRYRGSEPSRGDVDDSLGNFSLSLIDSLDTLAVLGDIPEFERAVNLVITTTKFDTDVIVSVFETNIRVLGGLLGGHVLATYLKRKKHAMDWYKDELLTMAKDIGNRLLPAFNTSTGIPYPRINLKHGINKDISANYRDTCTACAGTMILEFAALSRLTGDPVFEEKAHKAMDYLWNQRHRSSDLVGTVINIHNGDWIRRESGVGAGIDSYYEYVLKAYILLGDDTYLTRFNKHYDAVKKYISQGPRFVDVHMHRPQSTSRNFMDALLAFWPGLQVLKGDIQPAIEVHEMLYQVMQRHNFLPEAFTSDFHIHWGHHPLRPEFVESTYFLYKATSDPHYLDVGQKVIENLEQHARVPCGFAALKDVSKGTHEDQMDSFVLAETFKYLYLMFADKTDILFDVDDYIFTTEAHLLPLTLSRCNGSKPASMRLSREMYSHLQEIDQETHDHDEFGDSPHNTCPNPQVKFKINYVSSLRAGLKNLVNQSPPIVPASHQCIPPRATDSRLKATDFIAGNQDQLDQLRDMGIRLMTMADGRIQLLHTAAEALNPQLAEEGLQFMQEMIELSKNQPQDTQNDPMLIKVMAGEKNNPIFRAGPAHFGYDLKSRPNVRGKLAIGKPYKMCNSQVVNPQELAGRIAIIERGDCMFIDKARNLQRVGAIGGIVIDHTPGTAATNNPLFAMSGDSNRDDVYIPLLFIFHTEGQTLLELLAKNPDLEVVMAARFDVLGPDVPLSPGSPTDQSETSSQSPDTVGQSESSIQSSETENLSDAGTQPDDIQPHQPHARSTIQLNKMVTIVDGVYQSQEDVASTNKPVHLIEDNEGIINIRTMTDGSKQVFFRFDKVIQDKSSVTLEDIYLKLRDTLLEKTNFKLLDKQSDYLTAVVKLLESVYYGKQSTDPRTEDLFQELSNELEILSPQELEAAQKRKAEAADKEKKSVHHFTIDMTEIQNSEDGFKIIQQDGMNIKIRTKIVKPVPEKDPVPDEVVQHTRHYADKSDFEESEPTIVKKKVDTVNVDEVKKGDEYLGSIESRESIMQKLKEKVLRENPGKFSDDNNKKEPIQDEIGFDLLNENVNPDLAEGLKSVIQNSEQRTFSSHQDIENGDKKAKTNIPVDNVVKELPKYEKPVFEKTVKSLKSSDTKSTFSENSAIDERKESETNVGENPSSSSDDAGQSSRKSGEL